MKVKIPENLVEAKRLQLELSKKVITKDVVKKINYVGGIDVHFKDQNVVLGYVVLLYPYGDIVGEKIKVFSIKYNFPYIPEFLCFSEGPYIIEFLDKLDKPDVLILDGHGVAHPRRMGLASYVGVILDLPTIGCAKKLLYGKYLSKLGTKRGSFTNIIDDETKEVIGYALRTKDNVKEVIISIGHKVSLNTAKDIVLNLSKYRIPQPIRLAHSIAKNYVVKK